MIALLGVTACERERRDVPAPVVTGNRFARPSMLYASEQPRQLDATLPNYRETAYRISEGQTLYSTFNCIGCHARGLGAMGTPLGDKTWMYGTRPRDIALSIIAGRPNGMPSFRGKLAPAQLYALVAYVRSLRGNEEP